MNMSKEITITKEQFMDVLTDVSATMAEEFDNENGNTAKTAIIVLLVMMYGARVTTALFDTDEEEGA